MSRLAPAAIRSASAPMARMASSPTIIASSSNNTRLGVVRLPSEFTTVTGRRASSRYAIAE